MWENAAYLVNDERRSATWARLRRETGLAPEAILALPPGRLAEVISKGGMLPEHRSEKVEKCATLALDRLGGDLGGFAAMPLPEKRKLLVAFPSIGRPGADKVLLFSGIEAAPAVDSNGLRVLLRLGLAAEGRSYDHSYGSAITAMSGQLEATVAR